MGRKNHTCKEKKGKAFESDKKRVKLSQVENQCSVIPTNHQEKDHERNSDQFRGC